MSSGMRTQSNNNYETNMYSNARLLVHRLDPYTGLEVQEFKLQQRFWAELYRKESDNTIYYFIKAYKTFNNCFNNYLTKVYHLIKSEPFVGFEVFETKHKAIKEELLKEYKDLSNLYKFYSGEYLGFNFEELLTKLIEIIYYEIKNIYKDIENYEQNLENENNLNEEKNKKFGFYRKIFAEFWKNIPKYLSLFGFRFENSDRFKSFDEKYGKLLNTGLENSNGFENKELLDKLKKSEEQNGLNSERIKELETELENLKIKYEKYSKLKKISIKELNNYKKNEEQLKSRDKEVIELKKNIRKQKELIEDLSSSRDRTEFELKISMNSENEMRSEIKGLKEYNKELTQKLEKYKSLQNLRKLCGNKRNNNEEKVVKEDLSRGRGMDEKELEVIGDEVVVKEKEFVNKILKIELKEIKENFGSLQSKTDLIVSQISVLFEVMTKLKQKLSENEFKPNTKSDNEWKVREDMFERVMNEMKNCLLNSSKEYQKLCEYNTKLENRIDRIRESEELLAGIETEVKTAIETDLESNSDDSPLPEDDLNSDSRPKHHI